MSFSSNLTSALIRTWTEFLFKKWTWARNQLKNYSPVTHVEVKQSDRSRLRNTHKPERKNEGKASSRFEIYTLKQFFADCSLEDDKLWGVGGGVGREGRVGDVHEVFPPSSDSFFNRSLLESPHVPHFNVFFPVVSTDFPLVTHVKSWKKQQL